MVTAEFKLSVENVALRVGSFALQDISFCLKGGGYLVLLGPTGCGKTLLAETICGLNLPDSGVVRLDGRDVTRMDPAARGIGYVPQDYALLPFKNVEENIAFGLEARRCSRAQIARRVAEMLALLGIEHLGRRYPAHLSGGERQRVALGRALAIRPDLLVLDEPLSSLDEATGDEMLSLLRKLHRQLGATVLHICHRLEEAFALADTLAVMRDGRIEQAAATREIVVHPHSLFVARFLRLGNLVDGEVRATSQGNVFHVGGQALAPCNRPPGAACGVLPPEDIRLSLEKPPDDPDYLILAAAIRENNIGSVRPGLRLEGFPGLAAPGIFPRDKWRICQQVYLRIKRSSVYIPPG